MKPVNPIHFFNERGRSVMTEDHLHKRIDELEKEVAELQRQKAALARRLAALADTDRATQLHS